MLSDTHPDAERVQIELLRQATPAERMASVRSLTAMVINLSRRAIAEAHPGWSEEEVGLHWMELHYGADLAREVREYLRQRPS